MMALVATAFDISAALGAASLTALNKLGGPGTHLGLQLAVVAAGAAALIVPALVHHATEPRHSPAPPAELPPARPAVAASPALAAAALATPAASPQPAPREPSREVTPMNDVTMVVIAAAVAAVLPQPHQIVSVRPLPDPTWSQEGRRQIFASHHLIRH